MELRLNDVAKLINKNDKNSGIKSYEFSFGSSLNEQIIDSPTVKFLTKLTTAEKLKSVNNELINNNGIELNWSNDSLMNTTLMSSSTPSPSSTSSTTSSATSSSSTSASIPTIIPNNIINTSITDNFNNFNYTSISDLFIFDDLNDYINKINYSAFANLTNYYDGVNGGSSGGIIDYGPGGLTFNLTSNIFNNNCNININQTINNTNNNNSFIGIECNIIDEEKSDVNNWWALILVIVPCLTLFGNVLVILAVIRERTLQTVTNYFIVSLALADLLVAVVVMPFAVYVLVNGAWTLPAFICDFYIAMDVTCSTSSIFNLVAISIDRYIAVTQPIKYAKHKNNRRVWMTILLVWAISAAIGSPIVLGLNNTPERLPDLCLFYNSDFIIYSSLSSFYIPCIIMVFLYWNIFKALRNRAARARANRKPNLRDIKPNSIMENIAHTQRFAETTLGTAALVAPIHEEPTNTASGSNEDEDDTPVEPINTISNDKSTEFFMVKVAEEAAVVAQAHLGSHPTNDTEYTVCNTQLETIDANSNPSPNLKITSAPSSSSTSSSPPPPLRGLNINSSININTSSTTAQINKKNSNGLSKQELKKLKSTSSLLSVKLKRSPSVLASSSSSSKKEKNSESTSTRFTIYKTNKTSKKKREKNSAKKERKATKTLAIVLGVFLICWVPFFTCNVMDALCAKLQMDCQPGVTAFIITSWLGYMNSFVNPVIYTVFNPEFRKAFRKLIKV